MGGGVDTMSLVGILLKSGDHNPLYIGSVEPIGNAKNQILQIFF